MKHRSRFLTLLLGLVSATAVAGPSADFIERGQLAPCPSSPNCVSSLATDDGHRIAPLAVPGDASTQMAALLAVVRDMPRTEIQAQTENYLWVVFSSRLMRFRDDVEFLLGPGDGVQVRSASRLGYSDLGVNRARVETIRAKLSQGARVSVRASE
ncbi:MAG: DUF1499 domain-containing protein [Porticoccaceae bacterium]|nr:MAG: DUF1499 domain-containing protein [Porticoccaceae bacterium]